MLIAIPALRWWDLLTTDESTSDDRYRP